jgi:hypothetical protein
MKKLISIVMLAFSYILMNIPLPAEAQVSSMTGIRRNFAIVAFAGIGGAVLGLSTLSFYGTPQDHVANITTGFFLGLAGGAVYVVANSSSSNSRTSSDSFSLIDNSRARQKVAKGFLLPIVATEF